MSRRLLRGFLLVAAAFAVMAGPLGAADLTGKWVFSFNTENGVIDGLLELSQDGETLSAKFDEANLEGSAENDEFSLAGEYYAPEAGYTAGLAIRGKLDGEKLSGNAQWDIYSMTFTATRTE